MLKKERLQGLAIAILALTTYLLLPDSCPEAARRCAGIFVIAAGFWALDILPIYVTSLLVVLLLSFTLAKPDGVLELGNKGYAIFLAPFSSPVLMLFFGGFVLAEALQKNQCDIFLASKFLSLFKARPARFILGTMICTAFLSMWITNTAATVIMLGVIRPILESSKLNSSFRKGLLLAIPFSANIGGIATPIGTPPNALAIGFLSDFDIIITFSNWVALCLPLMLLLLCIAFFSLRLSFSFPKKSDPIKLRKNLPLSRKGLVTLIVGACTILLWLSSPAHGIPEALTALLCAGTLAALRLINRDNIKNINWDVLILMWGALALGVGIEKTGLGTWLVNHLFPAWDGIFLVLLFATLALILSLFISNTASAALIIPIALEASPQNKPLFAITIALMCSIAMVFPVSTPPNALAYGTGLLKNKEMIKTGLIITFCCYIAILIGFWWIIPNALK